ncbi:MAG: hypothetical protein IPL61_17690 [Myxococcales bacterium]|nr:hypothetical protein [Myxococcales bacterium]
MRPALTILLGLAACGGADPGAPDAAPPTIDAGVNPPRVLALDPSPYGLDSHLAGDDLFDRFAAIGIRWHRVDVDWDVIEAQRGQYDWTDVDRVVADADRLGLALMASIAYTPAWASGVTDRAAPPRDPADYVAFVREVVRRYRGRVACLGVWNEPNLRQFWNGTRTQYLSEILVPGLFTIHLEAPEMVTCGPDLSSAGDERTAWLGPILDAAGGQLDVITHHQYDGGDTVAGRAAEIEALHEFLIARGHGHKPLWITEIGWSRTDVTEAEQATLLTGVMDAMATRPWWAKTFWYDSHGVDFGIVGPDGAPDRGVPRAAYHAYAAVIAGP